MSFIIYFCLQIFATVLLAGVVLVSAEKKDEQSVEKKDKRGLFDLGYGHNFGGSFEGLGLEQSFLGHGQHKEHSTYDFKEIKVPIPDPYPVHIVKKVPAPYPVKVPHYVEHPVPVPVIKPYPVHVTKHVPYPVVKHIPVPVKVPVKVPYPVKVPVHVEKPYPVPVIKKVPVPVHKPYLVEKKVPYFVHEQEHHHGGWSHGHDFDLSHHHY